MSGGVVPANGATKVNEKDKEFQANDDEFEENNLSRPEAEVEIRDGGITAWRCMLGSFLLSICCYGVVTTFGTFQQYYRANQLRDRSLNDISWIGSLQLCLILLMGSISGPLFDAGHFRLLLGSGGALYVFCMFMTSISTKYYQFLLSQGFGVGIAQGLIFTPALSCLAHHFKRRRTIAFGFFAAGASVGGCVFPIALRRLFIEVGFGWAVRIFAFIVLFLVLVGFACCSTRLPPRKGGRVVDFRVFKHLPYALLVAGASLVGLGLYLPLSYGVTYAVDHHVPQDLAFYSLSILNASSIIGRILPNLIAQYLGPLNVLIVACTISTICIAVWVTATSTAGIIAFDVFFGIVSGTYVSCLPAAASSLTKNPKETGLRLGMLFFSTSFFWLASSPIQGALIRINGKYWPAAIFSAASVALGVLCMLFSRMMAAREARTWKV